MLAIDGSVLEGGGGLLRTALAISALTCEPIKVSNIRKRRKPPGLKVQHLNAVKAVGDLCGAEIRGARLGSQEVEFIPQKIEGKKIKVNLETAGSIGLVLQALLPASIFSRKEIRIEVRGGGTYNKWAPPVDYVDKVLIGTLEKFGVRTEIKVERHGFYPKGGALVRARVFPSKVREIVLMDRGEIRRIEGISLASKHLLARKVAERQARAARKAIASKLNYPIKIEQSYCDSLSPGSGITLWTRAGDAVIGADSLGELGKRSERVGKEAGEKLIKEIKSDAPVDLHLGDFLIPYLAMVGGRIRVSEITLHTQTNIWVCEQFFGRIFQVKDRVILCER
jgi:RNA 3'-terminal phosphate cyclase (GTP)